MTDLIGQTLGPYRIIEQIGLGGMATVYKAYQASVDRYVAIKVLPRQFAEDPTFMGRFEQEARTIAKLEHPHILPVHDYGDQDGITYLVMRFVEAGTLKGLVSNRESLSLEEILRIMKQVGGALGYAHSQGVIHRDIKPSNVLVDPRGDCFLTDFGIAKLVGGTTEFTATGRIVGTPAYMAPEQGMGEKSDARSDIYALGIILYEMVTGKVPYEAETPLAVLMKHASAPLPLPRQIKPDLPESVERVILKALSKAPGDRFQRVEDMVDALQQAVAASSVVSTETPALLDLEEDTTAVLDQVTATELVSAPVARRPFPWLPVVAGGAVALVVLVVVGVVLLPRLTARPAGDMGAPAEVQATSASGAAVSLTESPTAETTEVAVAPTALEPGWTTFISGDDVRVLAVGEGEVLWAGGSGGLLRWDRTNGGYDWFTVAHGLASNYVNTLLVDPEGIVWVATDEGLSRYDPYADRWVTFDTADGLDSDNVISLYYDQEEKVLVAGTAYGERGFNLYDGAGWRELDVPPIPVEEPEPRVMISDDDVFLVGLAQGGMAYFDGTEWHVSSVDPDDPEVGVNDLYVTRQGDLLAATGEGILEFNPETESWDMISQLDEFSANAILEDSNGLLWFAGEGGVFRLDPGVGDWEFYESESDQIPAWSVTDVVEDEEGVLWFGLAGGGTSRLEDGKWEVWNVGEGPAGNQIYAIVEGGEGGIWVAMDGGYGVGRYTPATGKWDTFNEEHGAVNWPGLPAVDREGRVWIGGWASAFFFEGGAWHMVENDALPEYDVWTIAQDESGIMWFGSEEGIVRFELDGGNAQVFTTSDGLPGNSTGQLWPAGDGVMLASVDNKLMAFDGTQWRRQLPDRDEIYQITTAPSGEVWVAGGEWLFVSPGGTSSYNDTWEAISVPDMWIEEVAVGPDGIVWAGGWDGLVRYDPEKRSWDRLDPGGGILPQPVAALLVAHDGSVWVGTDGGLGRYVPE